MVFIDKKKYYFETYQEIVFLRSLSNDDCRLKTHICFVPKQTWFSSGSRLIKSGNKTKQYHRAGGGGVNDLYKRDGVGYFPSALFAWG